MDVRINSSLDSKKEIDWIAEYIANEGYDIASYNLTSDADFNRFIEVKSYAGPLPYFYWSRNEADVAKKKKTLYWLYLVNRLEVQRPNYTPRMIQNPYETVLKNDDWEKTIENYRIELKTVND